MQMLTTKVYDRLALNSLKKRFTVLQGGSSSSKTYSILQYLIYIAQNCKRSLTISIVSETIPHSKKAVQRDFFNILGDTYNPSKHNKTDFIYKIGNSTIEFFSADNPGKVRGPRRDILFVNEVNNIGKEIIDQLEIRTAYKVFYDFNPVSEFWVHEDIINKDNCYYDISTYKDNPYLSKEIINSIESRKYNPDGSISDWYRVYGQGQIGSLEGLVYPYFEQVDKLPGSSNLYGLDFGFVNFKTALVNVLLTSTDIYLDELLYKTGMINADICNEFVKLGIRKGNDIIYADISEQKSIEEIRRHGYLIRPCIKGRDSIRAGIDYIKKYNIKVTKNSLNLIKELRNYKWLKNKDGEGLNEPEDKWNDLLDAVRYALSYKIKDSTVMTKRVKY